MDEVTKNKGFSVLEKRILCAFQVVKCFDNRHIDRIFISLAVRKKIIKLHTYVNSVKNGNRKFLPKLCTDFLAALPVETPWMLTLFPQKTKKIDHVET